MNAYEDSKWKSIQDGGLGSITNQGIHKPGRADGKNKSNLSERLTIQTSLTTEARKKQNRRAEKAERGNQKAS